MSNRLRQPSGRPGSSVIEELVLILLLQLASRHLRPIAVLLALGIILSLFLGGAQPVAVNLIPEPWDKLAHAVVFALLALAIGVASGFHGWHRLAIALCGSLLVGMLDEWHQMYLPGRQAGWSDLAADAVGSLFGMALLAIGYIKRS